MNSSIKESPQPRRNLHDSRNVTTILPPQITSTPFISSKSKIPSPLVTPTRKFSGPRRYALSDNGMLNPVKTIKDPPGPLLASTAYNVNVSTYIDTKSPGYAGRLVQYNEESSRKQQQTHQERYGSPGLLPIVHLFKKDVPVISPKMKKGTIRIGTPESRGYYSQEHNRLLLEGIVRNNSILKEQNNSHEVSTRSVLDALKEISRKRIHANEEYDPIDDNNKKFRKANGDGDYSKRNRVESPPSDKANSSPITQAKKRLCTIDAVLASKTSSMYATLEGGTKRKSNFISDEDSNNKILPMNKKKYNNVETQTLGTPVTMKEVKQNTVSEENKNKDSERPIEKSEVIEEVSCPPKQVLKVLDDKPLEVIRKNRLGALLSALSGREIPSIPMEDRRKALDQEWPSKSSEKPLVSILSPQNKQTKSADKHVTFNLLQSTLSSRSTSPTVTSDNNSSSSDAAEKEENTSTAQNEASSLISSAGNDTEEQKKLVIQKPDNMSNKFSTDHKLGTTQTQEEEKEKSVGGFKFDLNKPLNMTGSISSTLQVTKTLENNSKPEMKVSVDSSSPSATATNSIPHFGTPSFKSASLSSKSTFETSFTTPSAAPTTNSLGLPTSLPTASSTIASGTKTTSDSFAFGIKPASEATFVTTRTGDGTNAVFTFARKDTLPSELGRSTTPSSVNSTSPTPGKIESSGVITSPFGSKNVASVGNSSQAFPFNTMNNISTISAKSSNIPVTCSSLTIPTISSAPSFGSTSPISTISSTSASSSAPNGIFTAKTFSGMAGSSETPKANLGLSSSSPGGFKFSGGNSLPAFGSPSVSSIPTQTQASSVTSNAFGGQSNITVTSSNTKVENSSVTNNPFISAPVNSASPSLFGNNSVPNTAFPADKKTFTFGPNGDQNNSAQTSSNASSAFTFKTGQSGVSTTNTSASTASNLPFGSTVPTLDTTNNMFSPGKNPTMPSFGASTTAPSFGTSNSFTFGKPNASSNNPGSTSSLFGTTSTPTFGTSTTFGSTNSSSFGNSNNPNFGGTNTTTFGTTSKPSFGTTNTPSFGSSANNPNFGNASTLGFGTTNTPSFSTANTSNAFGSTNTPTFGTISTPSFGSSNTSNFSSTNISSFGNNNVPAFATTKTPAFGTSNITTSSTNNAFGGTNTTVTAFGTNNPTFGTPTTTVFGTTNTPTFGNATTTSSFGTSFSSPSTLNAPSFGNPSSPFGNTVSNNTNTFNSNNTSSPFGSTSSTNSFGTFNSNINQSSSVTTASTFGINTNNTFGTSSTANAFGGGSNASNNTFGSSNPTSPFGTNTNSAGTNAFGSAFGKKVEQSSSIFPAAANNMFNNSTAFGSAAPTNNGSTGGSSSSGVFTFGSSNSNAPSAGVFTFGATEPPKSFNFNASGASDSTQNPSGSAFNAVPSFAQPGPAAPNMFSIGSGNTSAPQARGRPLVRARRRT